MYHGPMMTSKKDALLLRVHQKKSELRRNGLRKKLRILRKTGGLRKTSRLKKEGVKKKEWIKKIGRIKNRAE